MALAAALRHRHGLSPGGSSLPRMLCSALQNLLSSPGSATALVFQQMQCTQGAHFAFQCLHRAGMSSRSPEKQWEWMKSVGHEINPCNSELHPAVDAGLQPGTPVLSVQEAYTPESLCYGCGPATAEGLGLRSYRIPGGLQASLSLHAKYCAFPGIINGGIISTLFDCQGNWTAALALMDRAYLPRPPLTLTYELLVQFKEPTPPDQQLVVRSQVMSIKDSPDVSSKATVQVDMALLQVDARGRESLLATGQGVFKKVGAMRAL